VPCKGLPRRECALRRPPPSELIELCSEAQQPTGKIANAVSVIPHNSAAARGGIAVPLNDLSYPLAQQNSHIENPDYWLSYDLTIVFYDN
jgi:hypothetical protein